MLDFALRVLERNGVPVLGVEEVALGKIMRIETLTLSGASAHIPPCLYEIWTKACTDRLTEEDIRKYGKVLIDNVIGSLSQAEDYCSARGSRYFFIACGMWFWFGYYPRAGHILVSDALRFDSTEPTVREALHFISHRALSEARLLPWDAAAWPAHLKYQPPKPKSGSDRGSGGRSGSGGARSSGAGAGAGGSSGAASARASRSSSRQQAAGVAKPTPSALTGGGRGKRQAALALAAQPDDSWRIKAGRPAPAGQHLADCAASFHLDMPETVLGGGEGGFVFGCWLAGQEAAVKLVPVEGADELLARLRHEAEVYCALRPLWGRAVPALLAVGYGRDRCCYLLATARVGVARGAELDLSRAEHRALLPAAKRALAAIHARGVLHGDLRADNILVAPPAPAAAVAAAGSPTVLLVDFGHARCGSSRAERRHEMDSLVGLFRQAGDGRC